MAGDEAFTRALLNDWMVQQFDYCLVIDDNVREAIRTGRTLSDDEKEEASAARQLAKALLEGGEDLDGWTFLWEVVGFA
jgi:hypothetical protein